VLVSTSLYFYLCKTGYCNLKRLRLFRFPAVFFFDWGRDTQLSLRILFLITCFYNRFAEFFRMHLLNWLPACKRIVTDIKAILPADVLVHYVLYLDTYSCYLLRRPHQSSHAKLRLPRGCLRPRKIIQLIGNGN
jgi:hypothetical protein